MTAFPSITSREYVPIENGVVVATRVPMNLFNFAGGEYITITGEIDMKLAGSGRRLQSVSANNDESEIASLFQLEIALQQEMDGDDEMINSANDVKEMKAPKGRL